MGVIKRISSSVDRIGKDIYIPYYELATKPTVEKIVQAIQILVMVDKQENPSYGQIAKLSGVSERTINRSSQEVKQLIDIYNQIQRCLSTHETYRESTICSVGSGTPLVYDETKEEYSYTFIDSYHNEQAISLPTKKEEVQTIERIASSLGLPLVDETSLEIIGSSIQIKNLLNGLALMALREYGILKSTHRYDKQQSMAEHFLGFYILATTGKGSVNNNNIHRKYFYEDDNSKVINQLIAANSSYQVGVNSMCFRPTELANDVVDKMLEYFKMVDFKESELEFDRTRHFHLPHNIIDNIKTRDLVVLFNNAVAYKDGNFYISLAKNDSLTDRVYSTFTSISSDTRNKLGYTNYDIGAALQTITLQLLDDDTRDLFPLHQELVKDKNSFRAKVMNETGESLEWVKEQLSSLDNKENYKSTSTTLLAYFEESKILRKKVLQKVLENDSAVYEKAYTRAKDIYKKEWDGDTHEYKYVPTEEKKESSVFFFVWTQYERKIRESMKIPFADKDTIIDVHDAIYSKEAVAIVDIEKAVLDKTQFEVKVSH